MKMPLSIAVALFASAATIAVASEAIPAKPSPSSPDQQPQAIFQSRPYYPFELRRKGVEGSATVEFIVDGRGEVVEAWVVKATDEEFGRSAVACVSKWKFKPGIHDGHPVMVRLQVPIMFSLTTNQNG